MAEDHRELGKKMVQEKQRGCGHNMCYPVEINGLAVARSSTIQLAIGEVVGVVLRIVKLFLLRDCLRGNDFRKAF